jgi:DNA-binding XRE family transcriptional regulator
MVAWTFSPYEYFSDYQSDTRYPKTPTTIGEHIRKRRLDLNLFQKEVAKIIGVSEDSVTYWETSRSYPQIRHIPSIVSFLGYNPFKTNSAGLADQVKKYRLMNGLSLKRMGEIIGVNETTVASWESGKTTTSIKIMDNLLILIRE